VSEEKRGAGLTPGAVDTSPPSGADAVGVALALRGASREDAGAFLKDQRHLIAPHAPSGGDAGGRLHLKWGEALYYAGRRDEARAQFARAAALDLTPSEKSELASARTNG
jgi:hypothetical protein